MKKVLVIVLAVVLVFASSTTAFAGSISYSNYKVFGSISQELGTEQRANYYTINLNVTTENAIQADGWKIRGYSHESSPVAITNLSSAIYTTGSHTVDYTSRPDVVTVKTSLLSSVATYYITFSGTLTV